jgi:hypothetical protein
VIVAIVVIRMLQTLSSLQVLCYSQILRDEG